MQCPRCKDEILTQVRLIKGLKDMYVNAAPDGAYSLGGIVTYSSPALFCAECKLQVGG